MTTNENTYQTLKSLCNNSICQRGKDPRWIVSEEYALTKKDFRIGWHTPGVMDGGIDVDIITRDPKLSDDIMKTQMLLCEEYDKEYGD